MTHKCITLLKAIFYGEKNIDTITKDYGYTNKHNAQNQKYKCLEQVDDIQVQLRVKYARVSTASCLILFWQ